MKVLTGITVSFVLIWVVLTYIIYPKETWHYKISVTIATPEGDRIGYAVRKVTRQDGIKLVPEMTSSKEVSGEAVVIDLGSRGTAIAILPGTSVDIPIALFFKFLIGKPIGEVITLPAEYHPIIVHYKGDQKKLTLEIVYQTYAQMGNRLPAIIKDDLYKAFGEGVFLKKVEVVKVDEPITRRIERYLPDDWDVPYHGGHNDTARPYAFKLRDFKKGEI